MKVAKVPATFFQRDTVYFLTKTLCFPKMDYPMELPVKRSIVYTHLVERENLAKMF